MDKKTQMKCGIAGGIVAVVILSVIQYVQEKKERKESIKAARQASDALREMWKENFRMAEATKEEEGAE